MKALKKLVSVFILGVPFALLPAGCAMGVEDGDLADSASVEASETQATDLELQTADVGPDLETSQGFGRHCIDRCWRQYRRCEIGHVYDRVDRLDRAGRRDDHCRWRYRRCLRQCFGPPVLDHDVPDRGD